MKVSQETPVLILLWFAVLVILVLWLVNLMPLAATLAAAFHIGLGFLVYVQHGKSELTPLGVFSIGSVLFLGIPYFLLDPAALQPVHLYAAMYAFLAFAAVSILSLRPYGDKGRSWTELLLSWYGTFRVDWIALALLILGVIIVTTVGIGELLSPLGGGVFYLTFTYLALAGSALLYRRQYWRSAIAWVMCLVVFALYYVFMFDGFGRLRIVSFGFIALTLIGPAIGTRMLKMFPLLLSPLVLYWGVVVRTEGDYLSIDALGSMFSPFPTFAEIITYTSHGIMGLAYGQTYLYPLYFWVPRQWWPDKPDGLGSVYVGYLQPELYWTGHSLAGSYLGEGVFNFGNVGIIVAVVLMAVLLQLLTIAKIRVTSAIDPGSASAFLFCGVVIVQTAILDAVWADTSTLAHRGLTSLLVVVGYALAVKAIRGTLGSSRRR